MTSFAWWIGKIFICRICHT